MANRNKSIRRSGNRFSEIPSANIKRSTFNRSCGHKTTFNAGYLVPIFVDDVLPGDTMTLSMQGFARLATPLHPVMDNIHLETFFFFVPNRLVWENWERFMGQQDNPGDSTDYVVPVRSGASFPVGSIYDYMGIPTEVFLEGLSALPFRGYNLIWNDWFRAQDLQDSVTVPTDDGPDGSGLYDLLKRGKRHDYFTSCLPWPQKGEAVTIPLGDEAPVAHRVSGGSIGVYNAAPGRETWELMDTSGATLAESTSPSLEANSLYADLTQATAVTINALREAFQIQKLLERDARGGTRYYEIIKSHFGVTDPGHDVLQRPQYLGGGKTHVNIAPVAQTSASDPSGPDASPQGNLAAVGTAAWSGHGFHRSFTEHGYIIGLACVYADLTYQQGVERMWSRQTRLEHYWPSLQGLGEQAVLNKEIYAQGTDADDQVFGYQERFAEYRYKPSRISGAFRSSFATSLDTWHLAQDFADLPGLGPDFIEEDPPIDRVIATQEEPHLIADLWFNYRCARPMPVYGVPGFIDHF